MKEIGGYFELELNKTKEFHSKAIKLNSGRNALFYILKTFKPSKIYVPYYICEAVLEPIKKMNISYEFYNINENFEPKLPPSFNKNDFLLYVNYFGLNDSIVKDLAKEKRNLITDNSQAFYSPPYKLPTFYSPRKFFGVVDGGYLYTNKFLNENLKQSISYEKCLHMLKRYDLGANEAYIECKNVEKSFSNFPIELMSKLTQRILSSIEYEKIKLIREKNFVFIHNYLRELNEIKINIKELNGPMMYPFFKKKKGLKEFLIKNKIYIPLFWPNMQIMNNKKCFEYYLFNYLIPIPIDQRYNSNDMNRIIEKINEYLNN